MSWYSLYEDLLDKPFALNGRGPDVYDCFGLVAEIYRRKYGIVPPGAPTPLLALDQESVVSQTLPQYHKVAGRDQVPAPEGTIALFNVRGYGAHVGFVLPDDKFVHSWEGSGSVLVERMSLWRQRVLGYYVFEPGT